MVRGRPKIDDQYLSHETDIERFDPYVTENEWLLLDYWTIIIRYDGTRLKKERQIAVFKNLRRHGYDIWHD